MGQKSLRKQWTKEKEDRRRAMREIDIIVLTPSGEGTFSRSTRSWQNK